ncbi:MAG: B12-binding domain-containing radical SAM protein [Candidatus Omnitrophica bacterium]|nr:B12-binding domain-containing radical SAM protein [Candidatus Omnitrophota bacterium]
MKVAFINDWNQHIGLQHLTAILKNNGHEVKTLTDPRLFDDLYLYIKPLHKLFDFKNNIIAELKEYSPDIVGLSVATPYYQWACEIANLIKSHMDVTIIIGGMHPSFVPERVILNNSFDMICVGEGTAAFIELLNSMEKGTIDYSIKNIWFKRDSELIKNDIRPLIENLDSLPIPDMDVFKDSTSFFTNSYVLLTVRGCPNNCSYCSVSYYHQLYKNKGPQFRVRCVDSVIEELLLVKSINNKTKRIIFNDTNFGFNINWLKEFSQKYSEKIKLDFFCVMHPVSIDEESIDYLKAAGCKSISLGIQTWDEDIRVNLFNRKISNSQMEKAILLIKKSKIDVLLDNLYDFPGRNEEEIIQYLEVYTRIKPTRNYFYRLHYFPKTIISQRAVENNWLLPEEYEDSLDGLELRTLRYDRNKADKTLKKTTLFKKMQILFIIIDIVPKSFTKYILDKKIYRYFPTFISPLILTIIRTLTVLDFESRYFRAIFFCRYFHFTKKKFLSLFNKSK